MAIDAGPTWSSFDEFARAATGHVPYPYQRRLAEDGLAQVLEAPTGSGKTAAVVLAWLWRRRFHPDLRVRAATPRRLAFALPMRVLVEQTHQVVDGWLTRLGLDDVGLHLLMGGMPRQHARTWLDLPEGDAVLVATVDMLLSRALNRGYGESRYVWPISFGLLNADTHWVFDEVQLMGAAVPTSRQLEAFRGTSGTAVPCSTTWMSATIDPRHLRTVDNPDVSTPARVGPGDERGPLAERLNAAKRVSGLDVPTKASAYPKALADAVVEHHRQRPGTRTIAIVNTVRGAQDLARRLDKADAAPVVLLHSRYRPRDRAAAFERAVAPVDPTSHGLIVVATQVIEAGVDLSSSTLITEAAPWSSIVQRAGRCNRDGKARDARLLWVEPPNEAPYEREDIDAAITLLRGLEGHQATPKRLLDIDAPAATATRAVLRRRDLIGLFDTTPDVSGNDLDVSRFIRDAKDLDLQVAWRPIVKTPPHPQPQSAPTTDELCSVPVASLREWLRDRRAAYVHDPILDRWRRVQPAELRPGIVVVLDTADGGYAPRWGWDPTDRTPVFPMGDDTPDVPNALPEAAGDDPLTSVGRWVPLLEHLADVERETRGLCAAIQPPGLSADHCEAAAVAGRLHDLGKAHDVFQRSLLKVAPEWERERLRQGAPWAKSGINKRLQHEREYFRHELVSALAVLGDAAPLLDGLPEPDLVTYLIGAHHGRMRLAIRSLPDERTTDGGRVALGVQHGDQLPPTVVPGGTSPACTLDLSPMDLGSSNGRPSWTARALALRDRPDLGPFRLAFLEALVRLADWRASKQEEGNA